MNAPRKQPLLAGFLAIIAAVTLFAAVFAQWWDFFRPGEVTSFFDINYYRDAVTAVVQGSKSMYDALPYPPFAFLIVWWLPSFPVVVGNQIWTAISLLVALGLAAVLVLRAWAITGAPAGDPWPGLVVRLSLSALFLLISAPMASQLTNGQLSLLVATLAFVDAIGVLPRRAQGVLVGVAGAIKITPLIFVAYYLVTGRRKQAATASVVFAVLTGLAWLIFPEGSSYFWLHLGRHDQFGDPARMDNWSIRAALTRISPELGAQSWLWLALGVAVVIAGLWRARRHYARGEAMESVLVVGCAGTVVAPIAWPHYFVWLPLTAIWLVLTGTRSSRVLGIGIYAAYSVVYVWIGVPLLASFNPRLVSADDLLVVIPMLIAAFGLPRRAEAAVTLAPSRGAVAMATGSKPFVKQAEGGDEAQGD